MTRIVFIGAGSLVFTRYLVRDILTFPLLQNSTIVLMDINKERLELSRRTIQSIIDKGNYPAKLEVTLDRKEALKGANAVMCTILNGGVDVWRYDIEIPKKYGIDICIGDTRGPGGIFRALRTIPVMLDICKDIERICPKAILLNYTNPMAMLCRAMQKKTNVTVTGLCHSVQETSEMLAKWINIPVEEVDYVCAGINHLSWFLEFKRNGKDLYPLIREAVKNGKIYKEEKVRNEMFIHLGYYVTESSGHNSEYNWWFRKRHDLIKKYCLHGVNWNTGEYAWLIKYYLKTESAWKKETIKWLADGAPIDLKRGHEYAARIINAIQGGETYQFNGNVLNTGLIPNLPKDACVEIPVLVNRRGLNPMYVGNLPPQLAAINNITIASEEMAVEGALRGDAELVFHAIAYDPLTAAVLSLAEIRKMVREMFEKNKKFLPHFKNIKI